VSCIPEKGAQIPDVELVDASGRRVHTHDWRQKSNAIFLILNNASTSEVEQLSKQVQAERKQWLWLQADVLIIPRPTADLASGAWAIDRYARQIRYWEPGTWTLEDLQREYIYYEARHC